MAVGTWVVFANASSCLKVGLRWPASHGCLCAATSSSIQGTTVLLESAVWLTGSDARNSALHLAFRCQVFSLFDHEAHGFFLLVRRVLVLG